MNHIWLPVPDCKIYGLIDCFLLAPPNHRQQLSLMLPQMLCLQAIQADNDGPNNVVVVGHSILTAAMLGHCLGIGEESMSLFKADCGGVTVVDFPREVLPEAGVVQCINYTAHLGRWSVPITHDDMDSVCGIEGCF